MGNEDRTLKNRRNTVKNANVTCVLQRDRLYGDIGQEHARNSSYFLKHQPSQLSWESETVNLLVNRSDLLE